MARVVGLGVESLSEKLVKQGGGVVIVAFCDLSDRLDP